MGSDIWDPTPAVRQARYWAAKVAQLKELLQTGKVLDVGCYTAAFLQEMGPAYERWGIEPSEAAAAVAASRGVKVLQGSMEAYYGMDETFDMVLAFDVLEHVHDQHELADRLAGWVKPGGYLVIETGDSRSLHARLMGSRWSYLAIDEHLIAHSPESLTMLLQQHGFSCVYLARQPHHRPLSYRFQVKQLLRMCRHRVATSAVDLARQLAHNDTIGQSVWLKASPFYLGNDHIWSVFRRTL
jgi:SAM-dependent methyltransferase